MLCKLQEFVTRIRDDLRRRVDWTLNLTRLEGVVDTFYIPNTKLNTAIAQ